MIEPSLTTEEIIARVRELHGATKGTFDAEEYYRRKMVFFAAAHDGPTSVLALVAIIEEQQRRWEAVMKWLADEHEYHGDGSVADGYWGGWAACVAGLLEHTDEIAKKAHAA